MQQGIKKLQWLEYLKVVFLEILNPLLCRVFANQVTYAIADSVQNGAIRVNLYLSKRENIGCKQEENEYFGEKLKIYQTLFMYVTSS